MPPPTTLSSKIQQLKRRGEGHNYINIIIDFSSWCTHFRAELLAPLSASLDSLFGLRNVYSFTHLFPLIAVLLFQDRYSPAQVPDGSLLEGPRCVLGVEAWLEGLRQKGWTLATIPHSSRALRHHKDHSLAGDSARNLLAAVIANAILKESKDSSEVQHIISGSTTLKIFFLAKELPLIISQLAQPLMALYCKLKVNWFIRY